MGTKMVNMNEMLVYFNSKTLKRVQGDKMFTDSSGAVVLDFLYKRKILRLKPQYDDTFFVILSVAKNLFCETKYKIVQGDRKLFVILNLFQDLIIRKGVLNIVETDSSGAVVLDFRVVDFLDSTFRLRLSRSVENLLLTSSLALLDSTLPKIRQNDKNCWLKTKPAFLFRNFLPKKSV